MRLLLWGAVARSTSLAREGGYMVRCIAGSLSRARRPIGHLTVRAPTLGRRSGGPRWGGTVTPRASSLRLLAGPRRTRRSGGVEWSSLHVALLGHDGPFLHRFFAGLDAPLAEAAAPCFGLRTGAMRASAVGALRISSRSCRKAAVCTSPCRWWLESPRGAKIPRHKWVPR